MNAYYTKLIKSVGLYICVVLVISMTFVDGLGTVTSGTVGVLGKGYISLVTAKVAAKQGYKAWLAIPPGDEEEEKVRSLIYENPGYDDELPIELISSIDTQTIDDKLSESDAVILASDDSNAPLATGILEYVLRPEGCPNLKRVVCMSRNLNNKGYGFFVKASKLSANPEVWAPDSGLIKQFQDMEEFIKNRADKMNIDYTIARCGTLKGGACGEVETEDHCPQYLSSKYYELTKRDIVTWQLLFDCSGRGAVVKKGDVLPGPGNKAVFTASAPEPSVGDTSRAIIADAMVMSLKEEKAANNDFAVGAAESRKPPTEEEWKTLFSVL